MIYFCKKKGRALKTREVENKFHCLRQNYKHGCINLERRYDDAERREQSDRKEMRLLRYQSRNRIREE